LKQVNQLLVDAGFISPEELRVARCLKQTFYHPQRNRFAVLRPYTTADGQWLTDVLYLEPLQATQVKFVLL